VTDQLTITGADPLDTVIDANGVVVGERLFQVITTHLVLANLTIRNGSTDGDGGGIASSTGTVELNNCVLAQNYAANSGGGIYSDGGSVYLNRTLVSENNTGGAGGGILLKFGGLTLIEAQVSGNVASTDGGGIINGGGDVLIVNSSIDNNTGFHGGGIYTLFYEGEAHVTIVNSTISANRARGGGGGIGINIGSLELFNTTIAGNVADAENEHGFQGGGFFVTSGSLVELQNTILANNTRPDPQSHLPIPDDCFGELQSLDYNLIETLDNCTISGETSHNLTEIDPQLSPLGSNGGNTPTLALLPGSPATDAGNPGGCENHLGVTLSTDQRSYTRPVDGDRDGEAVCDTGAFEAQRVSFLPIVWR
jgi:predicted outer membrane repeat protein